MTPAEIIGRLASIGVRPAGVTDDSRKISRGDLFMAYPGGSSDGRLYIADALKRRAAAVVWDCSDGFSWNSGWEIAHLAVPGLRQLRGPLAHTIFGQPSERLSLIAITGTNGKTSASQWIGELYPQRCAIIGTLGAGFAGHLEDTGLTTPEATVLMRYLKEFSAEEARACVLEASSIGIDEGRMDGLRVDVAVFTNFTRDHLDYHGSIERYAEAKEKLFRWPRLRLAIINIDDPFGRELAERTTAHKVVAYSQSGETARQWQGAIFAENVEENSNGLRFHLHTPVGGVFVETSLIGRYNVSNLLAAAAVLIDAGMSPVRIAECFSRLSAPPGRLEKVVPEDAGEIDDPLVIVDYAHTPDALKSVLLALREQARSRGGELWAVFGCGGNRDAGKRFLMGEIAARLADRVVLTSDNPRNETVLEIIEDIRAGAPDSIVIEDRRDAIRQSILKASSSDVVLLAGKGHEPYQEIAGVRQPFSDAKEARAALLSRREGLHP
ncbi:MAG: UDP-N-acetylmuramoyl-L-alanyl-D-glutamate--2,6-diaminopimelate ligase [Candidatus Accumulibacter sp.]|jgi:UDP-N-acetylmuramoyl-L-alanyl-D-glutamate--2,6-diaminopimelate ligase|nr:UDP-N-acetylmuramoyl-L-alanyl-D-glutamate--2,6-diaminopimelate ligase [Accumulibacter sp.]